MYDSRSLGLAEKLFGFLVFNGFNAF